MKIALIYSVIILNILMCIESLSVHGLPYHRKSSCLVRVRSTGFLPFEHYILPYAVIKRIIHAERLLHGKHNVRAHSTKARWRPLTALPRIAATYKPYVRLKITNKESFKQFALYDDNGDYLLDLKLHNAYPTALSSKPITQRNGYDTAKFEDHIWLQF